MEITWDLTNYQWEFNGIFSMNGWFLSPNQEVIIDDSGM